MAHLCGLCLALRADHGQFARIVTNYDGLIVSVLTELRRASRPAGVAPRACPLRAMRTAPVAQGEGARLAAQSRSSSPRPGPRPRRRPRRAVGPPPGRRRRAPRGRRMGPGGCADRCGPRLRHRPPGRRGRPADRNRDARRTRHPLLTVTEPTETATAAAFAHTAHLAGKPQNAARPRGGRPALRAARPSAGRGRGPGGGRRVGRLEPADGHRHPAHRGAPAL